MRQTVITYNGVFITNCVTEQFSQEAVFDPSRTDLMYHRFRVSVTGFCSGVSVGPNSLIGGIMQGDPAKQEVSIRSKLLEPRKAFEMRVGADSAASGGTVILKVDPYPDGNDSEWKNVSPSSPPTSVTNAEFGDKSGYDVENGPKCLSCDILQFTGNELFRVRVVFELCKLECDENGQALSNNRGVLSNRWSITDEIDDNFLTTRTFSGLLRITTAYLNPHEFRSWVVPPLTAGFYRKAMSFRVSEDSLQLAYTVVDRETVWAAPAPATRWDFRHIETTGVDGITHAEATCKLWADRQSDDQRVLLKTAFACVLSKLIDPTVVSVQEFQAITEMGTDSHSVAVSGRVTRSLDLNNFQGIMHNTLGMPISANDPFIVASPAAGYDPSLSRGSRPGDAVQLSGPISIAKAWRSYLQSPCDEEHEIELTANATPESEDSSTETSIAVVPTGQLDQTDASYIRQDHKEFPYTFWAMESKYETQQNRIQLGIAQSVASAISTNSPTSAFGRLSPPTTKRIVQVSATRIGKEPELPNFPDSYGLPTSGGGAYGAAGFLLGTKIVTNPPGRTADGRKIFKVDIEAVYGLTHPLDSNATIPIGFNSWETPSQNYDLPPTSQLATNSPLTP